jgi:hypothetical protein
VDLVQVRELTHIKPGTSFPLTGTEGSSGTDGTYQSMVPRQQRIQVHRHDPPYVERPERRVVVRDIDDWLLAPPSRVVPPAFGSGCELGVQSLPLTLVQGGGGAVGGLVVFYITLRHIRPSSRPG